MLLVFLGWSKIALTLGMPIEWGSLTLNTFGFLRTIGVFSFAQWSMPATCAYEHGPMYVSAMYYVLPAMILARIKYLDYLSDRRFRDSFSKDTRYCKRQNICSVFTLTVISVFAIAGMMVYYNECGVENADEADDAQARRLGMWRPAFVPSPWWEGERAGERLYNITEPWDGEEEGGRLYRNTARWEGEEAGERAGEQLDAIINEIGCSSTTPAHLPAAVQLAAVSLRQMLAPFEAKLHKPYAKFAGAGGVPLAEQLWPENGDDALAMIAQEHEPRSVVLHLEELEAAPAPFAEMLRPFLPLTNLTAHVYISNAGASALKNHTDKTEVLVLQLLGRKEWLHCREREEPVLPWLPDASPSALAAKLPKRTTYESDEMALDSLDCSRIITAPGDAFHLPRRTIHSARAVSDEISVHLTLGIRACNVEAAPARRRLADTLKNGGCLEDCDATCPTVCDESCDRVTCDETSCDGDGSTAFSSCSGSECSCDAQSCDSWGCDGAGCDGSGCDSAGCDGWGCDGAGCDYVGTACDYDEDCNHDSDCNWDESCDWDDDCNHDESCDRTTCLSGGYCDGDEACGPSECDTDSCAYGGYCDGDEKCDRGDCEDDNGTGSACDGDESCEWDESCDYDDNCDTTRQACYDGPFRPNGQQVTCSSLTNYYCETNCDENCPDLTCYIEGNYCNGESAKMAAGMFFIFLFGLCFVSTGWCVWIWFQRRLYKDRVMQMYDQEVWVDMFWVDMCKKEANQLFLLYTCLYTMAINETLKHMTPNPEDLEEKYDNLSRYTPAPTVVDGRYYTLNSPFMGFMLFIYTMVPLYLIYELSKRAHTTDEDTRDEERKALMEQCVQSSERWAGGSCRAG